MPKGRYGGTCSVDPAQTPSLGLRRTPKDLLSDISFFDTSRWAPLSIPFFSFPSLIRLAFTNTLYSNIQFECILPSISFLRGRLRIVVRAKIFFLTILCFIYHFLVPFSSISSNSLSSNSLPIPRLTRGTQFGRNLTPSHFFCRASQISSLSTPFLYYPPPPYSTPSPLIPPSLFPRNTLSPLTTFSPSLPPSPPPQKAHNNHIEILH